MTTSERGLTVSRLMRRSLLPLITALGLSLALVACVGGDVPEVPSDDAQLVQGRQIYASNCVGCHGADGGGGTGSKLSDGAVLDNFPDPADEFDVIADGKNAMPAFGGKLSDEEVESVVRYTREGL